MSICLLIMLDTLLIRPLLHCNTSLPFTTLHLTTLHYTYRHFTTTLQHFATLRYTSPHFTQLHFTTLIDTPSLHCNTLLYFTTLHSTTLHYTYRHFTSSHLHVPTLLFGLTQSHFLPLYFTSHHQTRHSTFLISKLISKIMNPFTALKNLSPFHFTSFFIVCYFFHLSYQPFTSLYFALHIHKSLPFTSLSFTFHFLSPSLPLRV